MKKLLFLLIFLSAYANSQTPNKMSFQSVVRNTQGKLVVNKSIGVRTSILQGSSSGTSVYVETHTKTSNANGLLTLEIGTGTVTSGTFSTINWTQGPYFLKTEIDVNGGSSYTITGVTEFVSVPYAINASLADSIKILSKGKNIGDMNYWNGSTWVPLNKGTQGQTLTFCEGKPTWAIGGICPGIISNLDCASVKNNGKLTANISKPGILSIIPYKGGNGGAHNGQVVISTGVTGLTATLLSARFSEGIDSLIYTITGTPLTNGIASFAINIGGQTCILNRNVDVTPFFDSNITDIDGNTYRTFKIGNQQWMADNLKTTKYSDGSTIINISTDNILWSSNTTGAWCYYNNDVENNSKYGKLYNWYVINSSISGYKNICPTGWHVPSDNEWTILTDYLGGETDAGGKMKQIGTTYWKSPNTDATNESLFTGLPGGIRDASGNNYVNSGIFAYFWSSSDYYSTNLTRGGTIDHSNDIWIRTLGANNKYIGRSYFNKSNGLSIRCLKD